MSDPKKLILVVENIGPVVAMKNSKMIARGRLITDPRKQKWMQQCIESFVLQCCLGLAITDAGISTVPLAPSWTASLLPEDDCWQQIQQLNLSAEKCDKGKEGAIIIIERI